MPQGSERIDIHTSQRGRVCALGLHLLVAAMLFFADFTPWLLLTGQILLAVLAWTAWRATIGLGKNASIRLRKGAWYLSAGGRPAIRLTGVRAGQVSPGLLSAQLRAEGQWHKLLVFADATDESSHWQLRRLVLRGIAAD